MDLVQNIFIVVFDETVFGYKPDKNRQEKLANSQDPCPLVCIPRKPEGLLVYLTSCKWKVIHGKKSYQIPFVLDIIPHLATSETTPRLKFKLAQERLGTVQAHWVGDSAFGELDFFKENGPFGSFSMSSQNNSCIWDALTFELTKGHWSAAINKNGKFQLYKLILFHRSYL